MNWKNIGKVSLYILLVVVLIAGAIVGYFYYQFQGKYTTNEEKYPHYIGYLSNSNESSKFKRCDESKTIGWYASAATYIPIFNGDKPKFKKSIYKNYLPGDRTENGFLNLRFIINCHGEVGYMEVNELDTNYEPTKLSPELVKQLIKLSSNKDNWIIPTSKNEPIDAYMYLIYKIENGEIAEILP